MGRSIIYLFVLGFVLSSCSKYTDEIDNLNNGEIWKMGHGGMGIGKSYPLDSRESLLQCLSFDMDGTEMDVQMTKDQVLVAFHDGELDSKTNFTGKINDYTWDELKDARFDVSPNLRFELLRLTDLFSMDETVGKRFAFDLKLYPSENNPTFSADYTTALMDLISTFNLDGRCIIESSSVEMLHAIRLLNPVPELYYYPGTTFEAGMEVILANSFDGITISHKELSKEKVKQAHEAGVKVVTWNTNSKKENKLAVSYHPDVIETDEVKFLSKYLP